MGGLVTDTECRVIDGLTDKPIPKLYAAGEATSGVHGALRLGTVAILDCLVFGRVAAQSLPRVNRQSCRPRPRFMRICAGRLRLAPLFFNDCTPAACSASQAAEVFCATKGAFSTQLGLRNGRPCRTRLQSRSARDHRYCSYRGRSPRRRRGSYACSTDRNNRPRYRIDRYLRR